MSAPELKYLPIAQLTESTANYRRSHDPAKHEELVASIRAHGILTPLLVRQVTQDPEWLHEVAAGHRRLRAARAAGVQDVPVVVRPMTDREFAEIMLTENIQRVDPHPLDEADAYQAMITDLEYDVATLAVRFGKSETYIRHRLVLTNLAPEARAALDRGVIELGHAVLLARVSHERQGELLSKQLLAPYNVPADVDDSDDEMMDYDPANQLGARAVRTDVQRTRMSIAALRAMMADTLQPLGCVKWDRADATLVPSAGSCTACPKRTGANPSLFAELDPTDDRCPDATCYAEKQAAWLVQRVRACRSQAPNLILITRKFRSGVKVFDGVTVEREPSAVTITTKKVKGQIPALIVEAASFDAVDAWAELGTLVDVVRVTAQPKSTRGGGETPAQVARRSHDLDALLERHERAGERFLLGMRAVVMAVAASTKPIEDLRDFLLLSLLDKPVAVELDEEMCDILRACLVTPPDGLPHRQARERTRVAQLAAWAICEDVHAPFVARWSIDKAPELDAAGNYAVPASIIALAATCDIDAAAVWADAIDQAGAEVPA